MPEPETRFEPTAFPDPPPADISRVMNRRLDLAYGSHSPSQRLDLYSPDGPVPKNGWPLVIFIHGGGWRAWDKRDSQLHWPLPILDHGFALASINYRLSGEAVFPAQIHDVKAAIRYLRAEAGTFGLDGTRFALWGASAGGHLAMLAGTTGRMRLLEDPTIGAADQPCDVQAVISWYGPTNFLMMDVYKRETGLGPACHSAPDSAESALLGAHVETVPALVRAADPETWLTPDCPPFLFQHASADPVVPVQHSVHFCRRINDVAGEGRARLHLVENAGHGPGFERPEVFQRALDFLREVLGR